MRKILFVVSALVMLALSGAGGAANDGKSSTFRWLAGTDFLCDLPPPNPCPDIAKAPNGHTIELAGQGTLGSHPKSVTGGGTFVHKDATGKVIVSGTWTATKLLSFKNWGGSDAVPPEWRSGVALIRIHLSPGPNATLRIMCHLPEGTLPPGFHEGVKVAVHNGVGVNFNHPVSGITLFIEQ